MTRAESQERYPRGQGAGWRKNGEQTRTSVTRYQRRREEPEHTSRDWRARGVVDSTQAPEKRESAPKGKVQSITNAKFLVYCSYRGSAGPSEKVTTPATECEVGLLKSGKIVSNELKTKRRAREDIGDENGRREGERETFTKAPSTGLVKKTIPRGTEKVDVRAPRESGREDNAQIPVLLDQGQGNATEVNTAVRASRAEDRRPWWRIWWCEHQRRSASEHPRHEQRRGPSEGQPGKR